MRKFLRSCAVMLFLAVADVAAYGQQAARLEELKREAAREVDKLRTFTQQMVDQIFSYSELGFQEYETSKYVAGVLEKNGFKLERGVAAMPTAWVADYGPGTPVLDVHSDIAC